MLSQKLKAVLGLALVVAVVAGCGAGVKATQEKNDVDKSIVEVTTDEDILKSYTYPEKWEWKKGSIDIKRYQNDFLIDIGKDGDEIVKAEKLFSGESVTMSKDQFDNLKDAITDRKSQGGNYESEKISMGDNTYMSWVQYAVLYDYNNYYTRNSPHWKRNPEYRKGLLIDTGGFYGVENYGVYDPEYNYYNKNNCILIKSDSEGNVIWRKVYLYYSPFWEASDEYISNGYDLTKLYSGLFYYELPQIFGYSRNELFIQCKWNVIFRLDENGMPHTNDPNLIVLDYKEYETLLKDTISEIQSWNNQTVVSDPIYIKKNDNGTEEYFNYDYVGQKIAEKYNSEQLNNEATKVVLNVKPEIYKVKNIIEEKMED